MDNVGVSVKEANVSQKTEDLLKYRPNPDMLVSKTDETFQDGVYKPPKFAPTSMEEDKMSKKNINALRKEKNALRQASQSAYVRQLMDEMEGRPEEIREIGSENAKVERYRKKWEECPWHEEELFIHAPITKEEKKREKHLKKLRNGLLGPTDSFYDEIKSLPLEIEETGIGSKSNGMGKHKKCKDMDRRSNYPNLNDNDYGIDNRDMKEIHIREMEGNDVLPKMQSQPQSTAGASRSSSASNYTKRGKATTSPA